MRNQMTARRTGHAPPRMPHANEILAELVPLSCTPQWNDLAFPAEGIARDAVDRQVRSAAVLTPLQTTQGSASQRLWSRQSHAAEPSTTPSAGDQLLQAVATLFGEIGFPAGLKSAWFHWLQRQQASRPPIIGEGLFWAGRMLSESSRDEPSLQGDPIEGVSHPSADGRRLRALWRLQELCRDRFGLLACQSLPVAHQAIRQQSPFGKPRNAAADELFHSNHAADFAWLRMVALDKFVQSNQVDGYIAQATESLKMSYSAQSVLARPISISIQNTESPQNIPRPVSAAVSAPMPKNENQMEIAISSYLEGDCVEVFLDGLWQSGVVERVQSLEDLYIRLVGEDRAWHFNALADLVRPHSNVDTTDRPTASAA